MLFVLYCRLKHVSKSMLSCCHNSHINEDASHPQLKTIHDASAALDI